jgi:hypothetical protein
MNIEKYILSMKEQNKRGLDKKHSPKLKGIHEKKGWMGGN